MTKYLLRRTLQIIPLLMCIVVFNFLLINMAPGDPARAIGGEDAPAEYLEVLRERFQLDQPLPHRLVAYLRQVLSGDLGYSYAYNRPVLNLILERLPNTLLLVLLSLLLSAVIGTAIGVIGGQSFGSMKDSALSVVCLVLYSAPVFWTGLLLVIVFSVWLRWFPTSGMMTAGAPTAGWTYVVDRLRHLFLPVLTLTLYHLPTYARLTRASVIEVMSDDFVQVARAKGLSESKVFFRHVLRNALLPTVTVAGMSLGLSFAGALLTETVFSWPGLGRLMYQAVFRRDYPLLMGNFIVTCLCVIVVSLVMDFVYMLLDPRVTLK